MTTDELGRDPDLIVEIEAVHFIRLVTGNASGPKLFLRATCSWTATCCWRKAAAALQASAPLSSRTASATRSATAAGVRPTSSRRSAGLPWVT